jgi:hypothetical protein
VDGSRRPIWLIALGAVLLLAIGGGALLLLGDEEASGQTVRYQDPTESGPDPFTPPSDVRGRDRVPLAVGQGPFGGTGSDLVCDRELLIRSLKARPDRLREWARVLNIEPTPEAVERYIRKLRPVTLTRDTRVTNHSFVDGKAQPYQAILPAGTAVLVDKDGKPVVRCRCGNPLREPIHIKDATCHGCPPNYNPPPPCDYYDYDDEDYERFGDADYKRTYDPDQYRNKCYRPYPNPPKVASTARGPPTDESGETTDEPSAEQSQGPTTTSEEPGQPPPDQSTEQQHTQPGGYRCEEANSPDRFEPGCQGRLVPAG